MTKRDYEAPQKSTACYTHKGKFYREKNHHPAVLLVILVLLVGSLLYIHNARAKNSTDVDSNVISQQEYSQENKKSDNLPTIGPTEAEIRSPLNSVIHLQRALGDCDYFYAELGIEVPDGFGETPIKLQDPVLSCNDAVQEGSWEVVWDEDIPNDKLRKAYVWFEASNPDSLDFSIGTWKLSFQGMTTIDDKPIMQEVCDFDVSDCCAEERIIKPKYNKSNPGFDDTVLIDSIRVSELGLTMKYDYSKSSLGEKGYEPEIVLKINRGQIVKARYKTRTITKGIAEGRGRFEQPISFNQVNVLMYGLTFYTLNRADGCIGVQPLKSDKEH